VESLAAFGSLGITLVLVVLRPRVGRFGRLNPVLGALPGVTIMMAAGVLSPRDLGRALVLLWRPFVTLASIMATTSVAHRLGIFDRITRTIEIRTRGPVPRAFTTVYVISALTAALFNNDAAILLLTPIVIPLIGRLYPLRPYLVEPFAFAVFMAAGVAPLCTSNPMNLVVAEHAGIGFNAYALRMLPVALVGAIATYVMMRVVFRHELEDSIPAGGPEQGSLADMGPSSLGVLVIVLAMFVAYPVLSYFEAPVWLAALACAVMTTTVGLREHTVTLPHVARGVAWDIIAFLFFIFVTALGLENIGVTRYMARVYGAAGSGPADALGVIGGMSALGSAVLNNHPMAALNALAIASLDGDNRFRTLAALVGGDLGPRFLPIGSLAGLLWLEMTRRLGLEIRAARFVRTGLVVTVPTLAASLGALWLEAWLFPP
jgi:arsenical pump membrane protein